MRRWILYWLCVVLVCYALGFALKAEAAKAVLTWKPPVSNTDGSALTNLAGYQILFRQQGTTKWYYRKVSDPGRTTLTIWKLPPATIYEFKMLAFTNTGVKSAFTPIVSGKTQ